MKKFAAITATALVLATAIAGPAQAADFSVSADKSTNLIAAGDTVVVSLANIPTDAGLYVRLCQGTPADAMKGRPANCFGQGAWVSTLAASKAQGAADATQPIKLAVKAQFTSGANNVDCLTQACLIHIRRDHMAPTDFSLDRVIPVTFVAEAAPAPVAKKPMTKAQMKAAIAKKKAALAAAKAKKKTAKN